MATTAAPTIEGMGVEEDLGGLTLRGRARDPQVPLIRTELEKCLKEGKIRSFTGVEKDDREKMARKVRNAGAIKNKDFPEGIDVQTRYDEGTQKLYWGPSEVMAKIA